MARIPNQAANKLHQVTSTTVITQTSAAAAASTTVITTTGTTVHTLSTILTTSTTTATVTAVQAQSTVYAACSANNVVNQANGGQGIDGAYGSSSTNTFATTDAVACCEQCQQVGGCLGFAQYPGGACYFFTNGQCNAASTFDQTYSTNSGISPGNGYTIGNGPCGQLANQGPDG